MKVLLSALFLFMLAIPGHAFVNNARGFIVNNQSDTIMGEVRINIFNQTSGAVYLNYFDNEILHTEVWFRPAGIRKWKRYTPEDLQFYSFLFKGQTYEYRRFCLNKKSIVKRERIDRRFLMLVHSSSIKLYQDVWCYSRPQLTRQCLLNYFKVPSMYYTCYEYYLCTKDNRLIKAEKTTMLETVSDLLRVVGLEGSFVSQIPEKASFKDLPVILAEYLHWKRMIRT
nr:hypothetical protein [uncultured Carboxylicivirga sp.]